RPEYNEGHMHELREGFEQLEPEKVLLYAKNNLSPEQMECAKRGLIKGFDYEKVEMYTRSDFKPVKMKMMMECIEHGFTTRQLQTVLNTTPIQMVECIKGMENGLNEDQVAMFLKPGYGQEEMEQIRLGLEHGIKPRMIELTYGRVEYGSG